MSSKESNAKDSDVLDFINSLPDSKPSTPKQTNNKTTTTTTSGGGNKEDLFEFLDELEEHEKKKKQNKVLSPKVTVTNSSKKVDNSSNEEDATTATTTDKSDTTNEDIIEQQEKGNEEQEQEQEELPNPISSITSWWNLEGSNKVNSLWKNITTNAEKISEQTYKLANETTNQLNTKSKNINSEEITNRLNNLFLNISNQIKEGLIEENDEVLNILIICDLFNLKYLKYLIYTNFDLVMRQVEGSIRTSVHELSSHHANNNGEGDDKVELNMFYGKLIDGEKLCLANLENGIKDYKNLITKHEEEEKVKEKEEIKENNKDISQSNIFISIQPVCTKIEGQEQGKNKVKDDEGTIIIESNNEESFSFIIILKDIDNDITIITKSQPMPLRWAQWLDGEKLKSLEEGEEEEEEEESIDPKEWVKDWIKQGLNLSIGILAQEYVIKRMGV